jgi:hypothetical protein
MTNRISRLVPCQWSPTLSRHQKENHWVCYMVAAVGMNNPGIPRSGASGSRLCLRAKVEAARVAWGVHMFPKFLFLLSIIHCYIVHFARDMHRTASMHRSKDSSTGNRA